MNELSKTESSQLSEHEAVIERGFSTFVEVGEALTAIRESRLYRQSHDSFEHYCFDRWQMSPRHALRLSEASEVAKRIGPMGPKPANERQARELAKLPEADQPEAWQEAVESSRGKPTAKDVKAAVEKRQPKVHREPGHRAKATPADKSTEVQAVVQAVQAGDKEPGTDAPPDLPPDFRATDEVDVPVPDRIRRPFAFRQEAEQIMRSISGIKKPLQNATDAEIVNLRMDVVNHHVKELRNTIDLALAYAVCPGCGGDGSCDARLVCNGRGWVTRMEWQGFDEATRDKHLAANKRKEAA